MATFLLHGDCIEQMRGMASNYIDAVVTDPPYGLAPKLDVTGLLLSWLPVGKSKGGFMGKEWDAVVPGPDVWREVLRVLKPGGHALVFGGTRTYHLLVTAMQIAGFEIRDQLAWMYGSGFPKSLDVAKQDGCEAWQGWGTALKPAQEPIVLARKPLVGTVAANVLAHGTGGLNIDACRIGTVEKLGRFNNARVPEDGTSYVVQREAALIDNSGGLGRWPANVLLDETAAAMLDAQSGITKSTGGQASLGAFRNGDIFGSGKDIREKRDPGKGDVGGASRFFYVAKASRSEREAGLDHLPKHTAGELTDREDGSDGLKSPRAGAGRTSSGRANNHPTVKPIALMRYLVRMITPPGGVVLDPFCGSGTTCCAAALEGFDSVGIDADAGYIEIAKGRAAHWESKA